MWRWWGFFIFVLFFSVPFSQPLWHNPRKNSRHFRHDSRTISETLWHEAEQPSKRLVQSKERLQPLGGRLSNERSTGNTFFIWIPVRYGNLKKSVCRCLHLIFYLCKHKLKVHVKEKNYIRVSETSVETQSVQNCRNMYKCIVSLKKRR